LLLVDEDAPLRRTLQGEMEQRGFRVIVAGGFREALELAHRIRPELAVLDLRLGDGSGIELIKCLRDLHPDVRVVIFTSYGNVATAVAAMKAGAVDYLPKPAEADDIINALLVLNPGLPPPSKNPMTANRVRWEHIRQIYEQCDQNLSETARRLTMHRRTLQRILRRHAARE
jgi:two-component system response regulator RegA